MKLAMGPGYRVGLRSPNEEHPTYGRPRLLTTTSAQTAKRSLIQRVMRSYMFFCALA